jgi:hypothetical protein
MGLKFSGNKSTITSDGIPYVWQSGDETSTPSYVGIITHPNAAADDNFGNSVAVGSGRIVVGAYRDDIGAISNAGSAHIYDLNRNYVGIITHPNAAADDNFGFSVAVGYGRIVVGTPYDDIGIGLTNAGSAHIYDLNGNYVGILTHPSAAADDNFGNSVAVGCGRIVVGTPYDDIGAISNAGSALIYDLNGNYVGILTHPNAAAGDLLGSSVAVGSGRIVVGVPGADIGAISNAGSALIYNLNGNYVGILTHPSAASFDEFGFSVAVGSGRIVVGALLDTIGIGLTNAGSAHIYDLNGNYVGILTHPSAVGSEYFGSSVAVGSGRIVVCAPSDDIGALTAAGSAHIYDLNGNYVGILTHPNAAADDQFGTSVAVGSGRIVVGASTDDIGIGLTNAGSAHIYSTPNVYTIYDAIDLNYG